MRGYATAGEIERYRRDGFVVLPDVLDPAEVTAWRATLSQAVARREGRLPEPGTRYAEFFHREHEYYDRVFTQKINLWKTDDAVRPLVLSPDLGRIAAGLSGSAGVRVYLDQALVKEPYGNPTAFHVDVPFWAFTSAGALTIWIAMDDATLQNGCLGYIPGSHREQRFDNADIGPELGALFAVYPQWKDVEPVFCPVPAGSAVAHNGLTAHGAGANMTPRQRFAMTVAYMPDGAVFNGQQDIYTAEEAARLRVGDQLADPALNPLVYPAAGLDPMPPSLGFTMSVSPATDAMKPDFQCVTAHSKPDFMASWQARGAQIAVLAVPVLTESGSRGSRARQ